MTAPGVAPIVTPAGSVSVSARSESATEPDAVFATVTVSFEVAPGAMDAGLNALESVTSGAFSIVSTAEAGDALLAPSELVSAPAGIVLV